MKMKTLLPLLCVLVIFFTACKKDKFTTEPQLKFKSITPSTVIKGNIINFTSSFTDDEGDIQDSFLLVKKRFNTTGGILSLDTFRFKMDPDAIPIARKGDINIRFSYGEQAPPLFFLNLESADLQISFGLIIRDKAEHRSNYVESDKITLKKL